MSEWRPVALTRLRCIECELHWGKHQMIIVLPLFTYFAFGFRVDRLESGERMMTLEELDYQLSELLSHHLLVATSS